MDECLNICHMYPELLNLYGDIGNILAIQKRCEWRGINVNIINCTTDIDFENCDILFLGGGSDREQKLVANNLFELKSNFKEYVENDGVVLAVCGGYQLLGHYYRLPTEEISGLGVLDLYTEYEKGRLIGNVLIDTPFGKIVGFENHSGRTTINDHTPLGDVIFGNGNDGKTKKEGVFYKNVFGTYLHGPVLPKNPNFTDEIIKRAMKRKFDEEIELPPLDDLVEQQAQEYMIKRLSQV